MKFSIITPSLNQGRFLPECVESVLAQKGVEFEHIVTDAGSTDDTLEVLRRYPHLTWKSEPDKGMSDGINKGFLQATGDWMMWLNCDDRLLPDALAKVAAHAAVHPDADVIHGDCRFVDADGDPMRRKYDTPVDEWDFLFVGCCNPSTSTFYNRRIIQSGELLDVGYRNCMDWEYYLRLIRSGYEFSYLPELLADFRWHEESTTQRHWARMVSEGLRAQRDHIANRGLPRWFGSKFALRAGRRIFQARRILKRLLVHHRIR
ncbi:glycosylhydrolase family 2 [Haloferula helveola]|uniref:Glycosylhydrolase family 2 n=1 Tax=Haloferula helveola TaxID=490095 RepID=A0ABM7REB8_9BACT|nr:glycosylhydrolase family 2 [Haloferula helveola]